MHLYEGWRSSASWRVRWALALKGVPYQSTLVDIEAGEHHRVLAGINPLHSVPTLVLDDGTPLTDSVAIIEWLEETRPEPPLLPKEALERARVRGLVQLVTSGIHPLQNTRVRKAISPHEEAQRVWMRPFIAEGLSAYEALIRDRPGPYSLGPALTMADLYLVPQAKNAERHGVDLSPLDRVRAVYAACLARPEVRATSPEEVRKRLEAGRRPAGA